MEEEEEEIAEVEEEESAKMPRRGKPVPPSISPFSHAPPFTS
jgi:hypothetical protein